MNKRPTAKKGKAATAAAVLSFVAAIAIVGTYTLGDYRKTQEAQEEENLAQAEAEQKETEEKRNEEENTEEASGTATKAEDPAPAQEGEEEGTQTEEEDEEESTANLAATAQTASNNRTSFSFDENSSLLWPVSGTILLNYSMDKTVYFSTLDQYKYNPAMIIAGAEGDQVICGAPGVVKSIDVTAQTGTTVNVDIGGGYELFYGQLKEVPVKVGDYVEAKSVLGYVSQPTKYYSVEGSNVYFEMRKDGQPVNPIDYLVD